MANELTLKEYAERYQEEPLCLHTEAGQLKQFMVNYVGMLIKPENGEVNAKMIVDTLASEFPEVVWTIAEENYLIGYEQGLNENINEGIHSGISPSEASAKTSEEDT